MITPLVVATMVLTGLLALFGLTITILNRPPDRVARIAVWAVVAVLALQAVIAAVQVFAGTALPETSTFLIYLVLSVCVLPIATQFATAEPTRWGGAVIAAGAIATLVAVQRIQSLWIPLG
ncbi:hypothetical protein [Pseudonocardia sp. TRM90224]|uniref:hypothetical protein n=1 Tax=Pseudonocardia sp. TRM90224 TaxID=2812678 RepID=UPI001E650AF8|nr:hypothetical protein [Pseudonocardia sp. TRM90224]